MINKIIDPPLNALDSLPTPLTAGELVVLKYFSTSLGSDWEIYIQPHLNGYRPDFVLLNPKVGIAVVEVKDWDLSAMDYFYDTTQGGAPKLQARHGHEKLHLGQQDPIAKIQTYKDAIASIFCPRLDKSAYGCITGVVAFPFAVRSEIEAIFKPAREYYGHLNFPKKNTLLTQEDISFGEKGIRKVLQVAYINEDLKFSIVNAIDLRHWLVEPEFSREQRVPLLSLLDQRQKELVETRTGTRFRKVRGSAGCGKSLVLAARAANLAGEGKRVLLVTFNITLVNYLGDFVSRIDRSRKVRNNIEAWNFHSWCKLLAMKIGYLDDYAELLAKTERNELFKDSLALAALNWCRMLKTADRYDAILVDEGQDFQRSWWIALRAALKPDGEMLLAADRSQNIYGVENWVDGDLTGTGLSSKWFDLPISYRMPEHLIDLTAEFAKSFLNPEDAILPVSVSRGLNLTQDTLSWVQCDKGREVEGCLAATQSILDLRVRFVSTPDITIVVDDANIGWSLISELWEKFKIRAIHTFGNPKAVASERVQESRGKKLAFFKGDARAKITTIQSFKGWESSVIILCISKARTFEDCSLAYTGMTRLKALNDGAVMTVVSSASELTDFGREWPNWISLHEK
jgi:hypothetical protein